MGRRLPAVAGIMTRNLTRAWGRPTYRRFPVGQGRFAPGSRWPGRRPSPRAVRALAAALLALAACQPQNRRALLLDVSLSDPALIAGTAAPWVRAGYTVEYRRFYPHLTRADLTRYRTVILLGGRRPDAGVDAIDAGDLALLTEWVPRGGVLIFGYVGGHEGGLDRAVMNRWLRGIGAGIAIEDDPLEDRPRGPGAPVVDLVRARSAATELDLAAPRAFASGRLHALRVTRPRQALASAPTSAVLRVGDSIVARGGVPVAAARRVDRGLVVVTSRHLLGAGGAELHATPILAMVRDSFAVTRRFLEALARWTRRPAAWARVPERGPTAPIVLEPPTLSVPARAPPLRAPGALAVLRFPRAPRADTHSMAPRANWIARQGIRGGWTRRALTAPGVLDSLLGFLAAAGLNVLASPPPSPVPADSAGRASAATSAWTQALARLSATSVVWFPLVTVNTAAVTPTTCLLDDTLWTGVVDPALRGTLGIAPKSGTPLGGIVLELTGRDVGSTPELCDAGARAALTRLGWDSTAMARLLGLAPAARYQALLGSGTLDLYVAALEAAVAARAAHSAAVLRRSMAGLPTTIWSRPTTASWRAVGVARGFTGDTAPVILWDDEPYAASIVATFDERGVKTLHTLSLPPGALGEPRLSRLRAPLLGTSDGFWVGPLETLGGDRAVPLDSIARQLRRLAREP